jgi:hypothetical protein
MKFDVQASFVSLQEWRRTVVVSCCLALFGLTPYFYAYWRAAPEFYFVGSLERVGDQNIYFMWLSQIAQGKILLQNLYTSIPHSGGMFNLVLFLVGLPAYLFGVSLDTCYLIGRFWSSCLLGLAAYGFIALFFPQQDRLLTWFLVMFSGGLCWLTKLIRVALHADHIMPFWPMSVDRWMLEIFPFTSILYVPLYSVAIACLLYLIRWSILGFLGNNGSYIYKTAGLFFLLSFIHPYDVTVFFALMWTAVAVLMILESEKRWHFFKQAFFISICGSVSVIYNFIMLRFNPGMYGWLLQNKYFSPAPYVYFLGFGVPFVFTIWWMISFFKEKQYWTSPYLFLASWIFVVPILCYLPLPFQGRMAVGVSTAFAICMMKLLQNKQQSLKIFFVAISSLMAAYHIVHAISVINHPEDIRYQRAERRFIPIGEVAVFKQIAQINGEGTVLSTYGPGNLMPRFTAMPVVLGAWHQTENFKWMRRVVRQFYNGNMSSVAREKFLKEKRVSFVYYGSAEQRLDIAKALPGWLESVGWKEITNPQSQFRAFYCKNNKDAVK